MLRVKLKRLAKAVVIALLALLLALAGVVMFIRLKYPSERLRQILIATLAQKYHLQAQIESLSFQLFSGFTLKHLTLAALGPNQAAPPAGFHHVLAIEEITLSYRWRSLFARRLDIDALTISRPVISYWQAADSSTNLDAFVRALSDTTSTVRDTSATSSPVEVNLRTIALHDVRINTAFATAADTQFFSLGPLALTVDDLVVDRTGDYRGKFKLHAEPAQVEYQVRASDSTKHVGYRGEWLATVEGFATVDSIAARARLALAQGHLRLGQSSPAQLPRLQTNFEAQYHLPSAHLTIPRLALALNEQEILAARYDLRVQDGATIFDFHAERGRLDLDEISRLVHAFGSAISPALQPLSATGTLDFSNSELHKTREGWRYDFNLAGENICYRDSSLGLKLDSSAVQLTWRSLAADSSAAATAFACNLSFHTFDFLLDTTKMYTGPGALRVEGTLAKNFAPLKLVWDINWRNFESDTLQSRGAFEAVDESSAATALRLKAKLKVKNLKLARFTADTLQGRVSGELALTGTQWDNLQAGCALRHDSLIYRLAEDSLRISPFDWSLNAKLKLAPDFSDWQFMLGTLQGEPATANFTARYQTAPGVFRFDLNNTTVKLEYVLGILPRSYFEGLNPKLAGASTASGWMNFNFSSLGELEYEGKFTVNSDKAVFTDDSLGIYADWLQLQSTWELATKKTTGDFTLNLRAARMPDYVRLPLPLTIANGKIEIAEETFVIKEGNFTAPDWHLSGDYRVAGKFLREGVQVQSTVNAAMNAPEPVTVERGLTLQGQLTGRMVLDQFFPEDKNAAQPSNLNVALHTERLHVKMDSLLAIHDLNADLSFAQGFDFLTLELSSPKEAERPTWANANEALLLYDILGAPPTDERAPASHVTIGKLQVRDYEFSEIAAELNMGRGRFDIPQLRMNFLGGNMRGNVLVGYGNGNAEELTYSTALQISSIDVSRLRRIAAQVEKGAQLSADFYLNGKGAARNKLDETLNNLAGKLNITKIEKKTATNLLTALDPNGTDAGIQRVRLLLKTGWNVKYMTFEIKNGFIYASLAPVKTKPWSALFNLPTTLDFARLPVKYFMAEE